MPETTVLDTILAVMLDVAEWIASAVVAVIPMFYVDGALTFLGILAIAGLAFSVAFLIIGIIQNFLHFRG